MLKTTQLIKKYFSCLGLHNLPRSDVLSAVHYMPLVVCGLELLVLTEPKHGRTITFRLSSSACSVCTQVLFAH